MGESFNMLRNNTLSRADLSNDRKGVLDIHYGDVLIRYRAVVDVSTLQGPSINITNNRFLGDRLTDGDIIMADTAEDTSAGKCVEIEGIMHQNVVAGLHTIPLRPATPSSHGYWGQYLNSASFRNQLFSKMQGTKVISLSRTTVSNATVRYPSLAEQRRIGEFFTTLDNLIAAAERQETLLRQKKQAYLQLMFPQEGETEPRLRFSGFIQNWRMHRMSEMVAPLNSIQQIMPDRDIEYRLWSVPSFQLGVPENVRGSRIMSSKLVLERDDILLSKINPRIQRIWRVDSDGTLPDVGSTEWVVFRAKPSKASPLFLKALLSSPLFYRYMVSTEKGATGSQKRADKTLLMSSCYWLPSLSEQQRIGAFFHLVDATLLTVQRNLAGLKELKRAYLQRMFI